MLVNTKNALSFPFLETRPRFSTSFSIHIFEGKRLIQKWIELLLSVGDNRSNAEKLTKENFSEIRKSFGLEPMQFSHLMIGNNIFCYYEKGEMKLINLFFNGRSAIKEGFIEKGFYSGKKNRVETFFWLFKEVTGEEKSKEEELYSEFQESAAGVPYLSNKDAGDGHPSDGNYSGGDG